ncbi:MAG TPA: proline dehydrogenase family protein, partial [Saprospiraceae bacterium]|nr:proline dehydrogenase family protein [Saprospiraceae bacterium]
AKYVPYGPVREVIPYLIRRAEENSSVTGDMGRELKLLHQEMKRRGLISQ